MIGSKSKAFIAYRNVTDVANHCRRCHLITNNTLSLLCFILKQGMPIMILLSKLRRPTLKTIPLITLLTSQRTEYILLTPCTFHLLSMLTQSMP